MFLKNSVTRLFYLYMFIFIYSLFIFYLFCVYSFYNILYEIL